MKYEELINDIREIALYDGWKRGLTKNGNKSMNWINHNLNARWNNFNLLEMKYHSSWDWLMPVVFKIVNGENKNGKLGGKSSLEVYGDISIELGEAFMDIENLSPFNLQNEWFRAVANFCKLYNTIVNKTVNERN